MGRIGECGSARILRYGPPPGIRRASETGSVARRAAAQAGGRAGFGPRPGDVTRTAALGLDGAVASWTLAPGRYMLFCSLPGHMTAGMRVLITVHRA